jgi:hypothetical protein
MDELRALRALARGLGVHTRYTDGLGRRVVVAPETLLRVCGALGAPVERPADAAEALRARRATGTGLVPPVLVAWNGIMPAIRLAGRGSVRGEVRSADGEVVPLEAAGTELRACRALPPGYHRLTVEGRGRVETGTVIAAPLLAWRRPGSPRSWGVGTHLAALARRGAARWATCGISLRCATGYTSEAATWSPSSRSSHVQRRSAGAQPVLAGEPPVLVRAGPGSG